MCGRGEGKSWGVFFRRVAIERAPAHNGEGGQ